MSSSREIITAKALADIMAQLSSARLSSTASQQSRRSVGLTIEVKNPSSVASPSVEDTEDTLSMAFAQAMSQPTENVPPPPPKVYSAKYYQLQRERQKLPVWEHKSTFLELLKKNKVIIVMGETGCGKTSQIPQWCLEYLDAKQAVVCTQPRRVAASSIAKRVAAEMGVEVGEEVGYHIRFDNSTSTKTILTFMTEGVLLRQIASNPMLNGHGVILLDECHERGTFADVLMGLLQTLVNSRDDLRLVIMSASLDKRKFVEYFEDAPLLKIHQRLHPIEIIYESKDKFNSVEAAVDTVKRIHTTERTRGDILVFMTGKAEIDKVCGCLEMWVNNMCYDFGELRILPLYGSLPSEEQDLVFEPAPPDTRQGISRKVILATNIAETSVTIDGIVYVIDCGYMNMKTYNRNTRVELIKKVSITQTNADQRAGRAGRTQAGKCYRLYTKDTYRKMDPFVLPEVLRSNLSSIVLNMKDMGIGNVTAFNFMDPPGMEALMDALKELIQLRALDKEYDITQLGKRMAEFPVDPMIAKALISSYDYNCTEEVLTIAAMLSVDWCFIWNQKKKMEIRGTQRQFISPKGDHIMLLKLYKAFKASGEDKEWCRRNFVHHRHLQSAVGIRSQLKAIMQKLSLYQMTSEPFDPEYINVRKALLSGFCLQIATKFGRCYRTLYESGTNVDVHGSSGLTEHAEFVIYHERFTTKENYIRVVSPIEKHWYTPVTGLTLQDLRIR